MSTIRTLLRATTVAMGSSAAFLVGGLMATAHADPAQPMPAPNNGDQVSASDVDPNQVLQHIAMALGAQQPAPQPAAGAAIRVPQPAPAAVPGAPTAMPGSTSFLPGVTAATPAGTTAPGLGGGIPAFTPSVPAPAAATPVTGSTGLTPSAQVDLPQIPFLPVPLPQQVLLPADLTSLVTGGVPAQHGVTAPSAPVTSVPATAPAPSSSQLWLPLSGLP